MSKKKTIAVGLMSVAMMLVAAGCGSAQTSNNGSGNSSSGNGNSSSTTATTLTIVPNVTGSFADNFNPFAGTNSIDGTLGNIYETMFYFDNTSGKQFNLLGKSFSFSNSGKTLTVNLVDNAKWTNGNAFSADDVVFTFNDLKKYPDADTNGVWKQLSSVKATSSNQVVFTFNQANIPFAEQYVLGGTYIVPESQWQSLGDPAKAKITHTDAIGTGPYKISSFSTQDYKFTVNKDYYGTVPKVQTLDYPAFASNSSADLALANGDVDWAGVNIPNIDKTFVAKDPTNNHYFFPPNNPVELYANLRNPVLNDLKVRQAMSMAINRNELSVKGETGYEQPAVPTSLVLPSQQSWEDPNLPTADQSFTVDDTKAEHLLQSDGYKKDSNGIYAKNGKELSFDLLVVSGWSDWDEDCLLIKQQLANIGINITVKQLQYAAYYNAIDPGAGKTPNYDLAISWTNAGPTPYLTYHDMLDSKGGFNIEGYSNPTVDNLFNEFASTTDVNKQKQAMYQIERIAAEQLPVIPLLDGALWYEYNTSKVTGFPTKDNLWINPSPYTYQAAAIVLTKLQPK